ncbi:MAG: DUF4328 domain-containing protein [Thermocrispum sp.]
MTKRWKCAAISDQPHRNGARWVFISWFVPILNLVVPREVVADVWAASKPAGTRRGSGLLGWWWACWLVGWAAIVCSCYDLGFFPRSPAALTVPTTASWLCRSPQSPRRWPRSCSDASSASSAGGSWRHWSVTRNGWHDRSG